jgi:hypothetical protein
MRSGAVRPGLIVDIKKIAEMTAVEQTADGGFRIGAAVAQQWYNYYFASPSTESEKALNRSIAITP